MEDTVRIVPFERRGLFIVLEGGEGSGKTTQSRLLKEYLECQGYHVVWTRQPGGVELGGEIRRILLQNDSTQCPLSPRAEMLLFMADRAQHVDELLRPALEHGHIIICDRYKASSFAYQHYARQVCTVEEFWMMNIFASGDLHPDLTFWIDTPVDIGLGRVKEANRMEAEGLAFHERVREGYRRFFEEGHVRESWKRIDGTQPIENTFGEIRSHVEQLLPKLAAQA